jgi:hypothetical protein
LLALVLGGAAYAAFAGKPRRRHPIAAADAASGVVARFDRLADTLALAIESYQVRAQMFDAHRMTCEDLARGLVLSEQEWIGYNAVRRVAQAALDSTRSTRDLGLYRDIEATERHFEQSGCARP